MTPRARAYLTVSATRSAFLAAACLLRPSSFGGPGFTQIRAVLPITVWGLLLLLGAVVAATAAVVRNEPLARVALIVGAASSAVWALGFALAYHSGSLVSPTGMAWGFAIAAKDLVVCRQPMWSPFETLSQRMLAEHPDRR